jgi:hypothetical protein
MHGARGGAPEGEQKRKLQNMGQGPRKPFRFEADQVSTLKRLLWADF